jgi:hypothetical protein
MSDRCKRGTLAGLLGTLADVFIHWSAYFVLGTTTTAHYIIQLMFPFQDATVFRLFYGLLTHFAAGALMGIILVLFIV